MCHVLDWDSGPWSWIHILVPLCISCPQASTSSSELQIPQGQSEGFGPDERLSHPCAVGSPGDLWEPKHKMPRHRKGLRLGMGVALKFPRSLFSKGVTWGILKTTDGVCPTPGDSDIVKQLLWGEVCTSVRVRAL